MARYTPDSSSGGAGVPTVVYTDQVGVKDTVAWGFALTDQAGLVDSVAWDFGLEDEVGLSDGAVITALGNPLWMSVTTAALTAGAAEIVCDLPAGVEVGDLLLAFVAYGKLSTVQPIQIPTGWTREARIEFAGTVAALGAAVFWRIADGTEGATQTFPYATAVVQGTAEIHRLRGTDVTTPIDVTATATLAATALVPDPVGPAVTTTVTNCLVFQFLNHFHAALTATHTAPSGFAERTDFESTVTATITSSTTDTKVFGTAASTGTAVHNCTETVATDAVMLAVAVAPGEVVITL